MHRLMFFALMLAGCFTCFGCSNSENVVVEDTRTEAEQEQAYQAYDQQLIQDKKEYEAKLKAAK